MAESASIKNISHRHSMLMNWMVLNPHRNLRECADHFGITQAWLSTVIHSDVFQAEFQEKLKNIHVRCAESIPEKLRVVADIALEKLAEKISDSEDPEFILDAADKALHRMGYAPASARNGYGAGPAGAVNIQQNMFMLSQEDLDKARGIMRNQGLFQVPEEAQDQAQDLGAGTPAAFVAFESLQDQPPGQDSENVGVLVAEHVLP